jgi:hypothetical protein
MPAYSLKDSAQRIIHLPLADRLANRVQLTTYAHSPYLSAVEDAIGTEVDYAMLMKIYGVERQGEAH